MLVDAIIFCRSCKFVLVSVPNLFDSNIVAVEFFKMDNTISGGNFGINQFDKIWLAAYPLPYLLDVINFKKVKTQVFFQ